MPSLVANMGVSSNCNKSKVPTGKAPISAPLKPDELYSTFPVILPVSAMKFIPVVPPVVACIFVFFPKLNELQKIEREFGEGKKEIIDNLKKLIKDNASEQEILEEVAKYEKLHKDKLTKQMNKIKELWKILTPIQRAKFLIFQEEFNKEIREMIKKIKKDREP